MLSKYDFLQHIFRKKIREGVNTINEKKIQLKTKMLILFG
jgi:hypothetical protein